MAPRLRRGVSCSGRRPGQAERRSAGSHEADFVVLTGEAEAVGLHPGVEHQFGEVGDDPVGPDARGVEGAHPGLHRLCREAGFQGPGQYLAPQRLDAVQAVDAGNSGQVRLASAQE